MPDSVTRVALTGATGFIGRHITALLLRNGCSVRALVRDPARAKTLLGPSVELLCGELGASTALRQLVDGQDALIHLAGAVRGRSQEDFDRVNVDGTARLLDAVTQTAPDIALLMFSSLAAREPGLSHYAHSKHRAEQLLHCRGPGSPSVILRPPAVYGPGDREMLPVFRFMARTGRAPVAGNPSARLSLIYVDDLARAALCWLMNARHSMATYTLHDGHPGGYDWRELCDTVAAACSRKVHPWQIPPRALDLLAHGNRALSRLFGYAPMLTPEKLRELRHPDWVCDNSEIYGGLGWHPRVELAEGLRLTPDWH